MIRSFLQILLEGEGYRVSEVEDGAGMFGALAEGPVDLIVLDIMLPDGNGVDFARQLRRSNGVPIVFATAVTDTETRRRAFGLMNVDYVNKPFDAKELLLRVSSILKGSPIMEDPNANAGPPPATDTLTWTRAPLIWGPALAFLIVAIGGYFFLPKSEDPMDMAERAEGTGVGGTIDAFGGSNADARKAAEAAAAQSGVVMRDAVQGQPLGGNGAAAAGSAAAPVANGGSGVGSGAAAGSPEAKIAAACGELPISEHFNNNSVPRVLRYVHFVHKGDWGAYLDSWEIRLKNVEDLEHAGKSIELSKKGIVLSGKELRAYVELMQRRVKFLRCTKDIMATIK